MRLNSWGLAHVDLEERVKLMTSCMFEETYLCIFHNLSLCLYTITSCKQTDLLLFLDFNWYTMLGNLHFYSQQFLPICNFTYITSKEFSKQFVQGTYLWIILAYAPGEKNDVPNAKNLKFLTLHGKRTIFLWRVQQRNLVLHKSLLEHWFLWFLPRPQYIVSVWNFACMQNTWTYNMYNFIFILNFATFFNILLFATGSYAWRGQNAAFPLLS
jgi:hypothetical protein